MGDSKFTACPIKSFSVSGDVLALETNGLKPVDSSLGGSVMSYSTASEVDLKIPMCISTNAKRRDRKLYLSITPPSSKKVRINKNDISREVASIDICLSVPSNKENEAAKLAKSSRQLGITVEDFDFHKRYMPVRLNQDSIDIDFSREAYVYELALIGQGRETVYLPIISITLNSHDKHYLDLLGYTPSKMIY